MNDFYQRVLGLLQDSERLGFDAAWANEHHFHPYGGLISSPARPNQKGIFRSSTGDR